MPIRMASGVTGSWVRLPVSNRMVIWRARASEEEEDVGSLVREGPGPAKARGGFVTKCDRTGLPGLEA